MALDGCGADPDGRRLVEASLDPSRPAAAPPDCLILDGQGELVERFRSGCEHPEALAALHAALAARSNQNPGPPPPPEPDEAWTRYEGGLERMRAGDAVGARAIWQALVADEPDHFLRHRVAWHQQQPVFLPPHPDLAGVPAATAQRPIELPDPALRAANLARLRDDPGVRWSPSGIPFIRVPAGTFIMGGSPAQKPSELPRRRVTLTRPFWLAAWPVTTAVWGQVISGEAMDGLPGEVPRTGLGMGDVERLCEALEASDGWRYRLPTEAEWERAARGGLEGAMYPWGDAPITPARSNYDRPRPLPVACYEPNAYGLFDMVGNTPEWTSDPHQADAYSLTSVEVIDPTGPPRDASRNPLTRVVRGGACQRPFMALLCRNSRRLAAPEAPPPWMQISARLVAEPPSTARD